ncbi:LHT2 [Scenedesmus sp. PABB004]|nr:LHT2 [Scenedesmus sp. PABB004]
MARRRALQLAVALLAAVAASAEPPDAGAAGAAAPAHKSHGKRAPPPSPAPTCTAPNPPDVATRPYCFQPPTVSPEAAAALRERAVVPAMACWTDACAEAMQQAYSDLCAPFSAAAAAKYLASVSNETVGGVPCTLATPKPGLARAKAKAKAGAGAGRARAAARTRSLQSGERLLVYIHGGAHVKGNCHTLHQMTAPVAALAGLRALCVGIRLAPQHPFPAALDDAVAAWRALVGPPLGLSAARIAVMGDSSGGGLVLSLMQRLRRAALPLPGAVVLLAPWADVAKTGDTMTTLTGVSPVLQWELNLAAPARAYVGGDESRWADPLVSPLRAPDTASLYGAGFPRTLIQVGLRDGLLSQAVLLYRQMAATGADVTFSPYEGMWHVFQALALTVPEGRGGSMQPLGGGGGALQRHGTRPPRAAACRGAAPRGAGPSAPGSRQRQQLQPPAQQQAQQPGGVLQQPQQQAIPWLPPAASTGGAVGSTGTLGGGAAATGRAAAAPPPQAGLRPARKPEVLAPAGGWPQLRAAVENGADAVYFGVTGFNARARSLPAPLGMLGVPSASLASADTSVSDPSTLAPPAVPPFGVLPAPPPRGAGAGAAPDAGGDGGGIAELLSAVTAAASAAGVNPAHLEGVLGLTGLLGGAPAPGGGGGAGAGGDEITADQAAAALTSAFQAAAAAAGVDPALVAEALANLGAAAAAQREAGGAPLALPSPGGAGAAAMVTIVGEPETKAGDLKVVVEDQHARRTANWLDVAYHSVTGMIGAGVLSLPAVFSHLGWTGGIIVLLFSFWVSWYTYKQLVYMHEVPDLDCKEGGGLRRLDRYDQLSTYLLGERRGKLALMPFQLVGLVGTGITYTVVGGDSLHAFCDLVSHGGTAHMSRWPFYIIFGGLQLLLSLLPSFNELSLVSLLGAIMSVGYCAIAVAMSATISPAPGTVSYDPMAVPRSPVSRAMGVFNAISRVLFAYGGHNVALEIQATIPIGGKHPASSVPAMMRGVNATFILTGLIYFGVSVVGFWAFGTGVADNVLLSFTHGPHSWAVAMADMFVVVHVAAAYQVYTQPVFQIIELGIRRRTGAERVNPFLATGIRLAYVAAVTVVGIAIPFFSILMGLFGALSATPTSFLLPPLFWLLYKRPARWGLEWSINVFLVGITGIIGVLGTQHVHSHSQCSGPSVGRWARSGAAGSMPLSGGSALQRHGSRPRGSAACRGAAPRGAGPPDPGSRQRRQRQQQGGAQQQGERPPAQQQTRPPGGVAERVGADVAARKNPELYSLAASPQQPQQQAIPWLPPAASTGCSAGSTGTLGGGAAAAGRAAAAPPPQAGLRPARKPEVLAPAGGWPQLRAAVENGADAVYFGVTGFNARARAANFEPEELPEVMSFLRNRGVKGYVALNILRATAARGAQVFDEELPRLEALVRQLAAAGVDAAIVQDVGAVALIRRVAPHLPIHGSTQMSITSAEGAQFAASLGVTRVVVGRELSVREIAAVSRGTSTEVEAFCHGAMCVSYSGQCFSSEAWGGRSANRGQCAQACRMPYALIVDGEVKDLSDMAYLLSPQDQMALGHLPAMIAAGVGCFKIEGRLKGPEYVAATTAAYCAGVDAAWEALLAEEEAAEAAAREGAERCASNAASSTSAAAVDPALLADLEQVFARGQDEEFGGLTPGFLEGSQHQRLVRGRAPRHRGRCLGRVAAVTPRGVVLAGLRAPVKRGDGVVFDQGRPEQDEPGGAVWELHAPPAGGRRGARLEGEAPAGADVELSFGPGAVDLSRLAPGDLVWKSRDPALEARLRESYESVSSTTARKLPVQVAVSGAVGAPLALTLTDPAGNTVSADTGGVALARAAKRAMTADDVAAGVGQLGDNALAPASIDVSGLALDQGIFLPASAFKAVRRAAAEALLAARAAHGHDRDLAAGPVLPRMLAAAGRPGGNGGGSSPSGGRSSAGGGAEAGGDGGGGGGGPQLRVLCRSPAQVDAALRVPWLGEVVLDFLEVHGLKEAVAAVKGAGKVAVVALPRIIKPEESRLLWLFLRLRADALLLRGAGCLQQLRDLGGPGAAVAGVAALGGGGASGSSAGAGGADGGSPGDGSVIIPRLEGDFSLNAANALAADLLLGSGLSRLCPTHDLNAAQLAALAHGLGGGAAAGGRAGQLEAVVHQHLPIFHTEACLFCRFLSDGNSYLDCGHPCERHSVALRDGAGADHLVLADQGCRNTVFNATPQSGLFEIPRLAAAGFGTFRLELVGTEPPQLVAALLEAYRAVLVGEARPGAAWAEVRAACGGRLTPGSLEVSAERAAGSLRPTARRR